MGFEIELPRRMPNVEQVGVPRGSGPGAGGSYVYYSCDIEGFEL